MILTKRFNKQFFSFALMFTILFSGQNIGHAEKQYSDNLIEVHQGANSTILPTRYLLHIITYFLFGLLIDLALIFRKKTSK